MALGTCTASQTRASPPAQPAPPVNPDPKAHPIHPVIPTQPIHEGSDPSTPITETDDIRPR